MVKRVSLVRLRPDVPREECLSRWFGAHAEIVRVRPEVREYTVDVATTPVPEGGWDAVATLRFDDEESMRRCLEDPAVKEPLLRTRDEFAAAVQVMLVEEHRLVPAGGAR
jgi:hypothetical protein